MNSDFDMSDIVDCDLNDCVPSEETCMNVMSINVKQSKLKTDKGNVKQHDHERFGLSLTTPKPLIEMIAESHDDKKLGMKIHVNIQDILTQTNDQGREIFNFRNRHSADFKRVLVKDSIKMDSCHILRLINRKSQEYADRNGPESRNEIISHSESED